MKSLLIAASLVTLANQTPDSDALLKKEFLGCDQRSSQYMLDDGEAAYCSEVYEKLKNQAFNGDAAALLRWWQSEKSQKTTQ